MLRGYCTGRRNARVKPGPKVKVEPSEPRHVSRDPERGGGRRRMGSPSVTAKAFFGRAGDEEVGKGGKDRTAASLEGETQRAGYRLARVLGRYPLTYRVCVRGRVTRTVNAELSLRSNHLCACVRVRTVGGRFCGRTPARSCGHLH